MICATCGRDHVADNQPTAVMPDLGLVAAPEAWAVTIDRLRAFSESQAQQIKVLEGRLTSLEADNKYLEARLGREILLGNHRKERLLP